MSDPDSPLSPAQDDAVRRLLASARHTDPVPADVAARLDETLASLTSQRREVPAPVVTLASRRRRIAGTALLAAAAVVVVGVGIGQVLPLTESGDDSAGSTADSSTLAEDRAPSESELQSDSGADEKQREPDMRSQESPPSATLGAAEDLGVLTSDAGLRRQVRALRPEQFSSSYSGVGCLVDPATPGDHVAVTYNGRPGVLVYRVPAGSTQQVDLFVCGEPDAVRSLELRAP